MLNILQFQYHTLKWIPLLRIFFFLFLNRVISILSSLKWGVVRNCFCIFHFTSIFLSRKKNVKWMRRSEYQKSLFVIFFESSQISTMSYSVYLHLLWLFWGLQLFETFVTSDLHFFLSILRSKFAVTSSIADCNLRHWRLSEIRVSIVPSNFRRKLWEIKK